MTQNTKQILAVAKVLGVKSITINEFGYPPPLSQQQSFGTSVTSRTTPILTGQEQVSANVGIVFLIG